MIFFIGQTDDYIIDVTCRIGMDFRSCPINEFIFWGDVLVSY